MNKQIYCQTIQTIVWLDCFELRLTGRSPVDDSHRAVSLLQRYTANHRDASVHVHKVEHLFLRINGQGAGFYRVWSKEWLWVASCQVDLVDLRPDVLCFGALTNHWNEEVVVDDWILWTETKRFGWFQYFSILTQEHDQQKRTWMYLGNSLGG